MWGVDPRLLCDKHLLGEHGEIHKFIPTFAAHRRVHKRFYPIVQIQFKGYKGRHDLLAVEMINRGFNHMSPLLLVPDFKYIYPEYFNLEIDLEYNIQDLKNRCRVCREIIEWESNY
jgi:hypothetical protein